MDAGLGATVAAGGAGASGNASGSVGGTSSFGAHCTANGGSGYVIVKGFF